MASKYVKTTRKPYYFTKSVDRVVYSVLGTFFCMNAYISVVICLLMYLIWKDTFPIMKTHLRQSPVVAVKEAERPCVTSPTAESAEFKPSAVLELWS